MMKKKLFTVVLLILAAGVIVSAAEVINVDLNGYGDDRGYVGNGAYDVGANAVWTVYYGGWGRPIGSSRTEGLVGVIPLEEQWYSATYAAQTWIGDDGLNHGYLSGNALLDDGFFKNGASNPKINLFGEGAYQGVYDIYVYGAAAGSFTLNYYGTPTTQSVTGDAAPGQFELGKNYVVFDNVNINNANSADVYIEYTNIINGLQLVKQKEPFAIEPNSLGLIRIPAGDYDVAGDRNTREDETQPQGPDVFYDADLAIGNYVGYLDSQEFMEYDITVDEANEGQYEINLGIMGGTYGTVNNGTMFIFLDDHLLGDVNLLTAAPTGEIAHTTKVKANLYEGSHRVKWLLTSTELNYAATGANIADVNFTRLGNPVISNCADVVNYGFGLVGDLNGDCRVDYRDLKLAVDDWVQCNDPNQDNCF